MPPNAAGRRRRRRFDLRQVGDVDRLRAATRPRDSSSRGRLGALVGVHVPERDAGARSRKRSVMAGRTLGGAGDDGTAAFEIVLIQCSFSLSDLLP